MKREIVLKTANHMKPMSAPLGMYRSYDYFIIIEVNEICSFYFKNKVFKKIPLKLEIIKYYKHLIGGKRAEFLEKLRSEKVNINEKYFNYFYSGCRRFETCTAY